MTAQEAALEGLAGLRDNFEKAAKANDKRGRFAKYFYRSLGPADPDAEAAEYRRYEGKVKEIEDDLRQGETNLARAGLERLESAFRRTADFYRPQRIMDTLGAAYGLGPVMQDNPKVGEYEGLAQRARMIRDLI